MHGPFELVEDLESGATGMQVYEFSLPTLDLMGLPGCTVNHSNVSHKGLGFRVQVLFAKTAELVDRVSGIENASKRNRVKDMWLCT